MISGHRRICLELRKNMSNCVLYGPGKAVFELTPVGPMKKWVYNISSDDPLRIQLEVLFQLRTIS